jgi:hypothetical protein
MLSNKDAELTAAAMLYAIRCLTEGDTSALRSMNFGPREVEALRDMNLSDLCHIETLRAHCLTITLDRQVYWPMVSHLKRLRDSEELQKLLISADAPYAMMQTFFGMSGREYARLRRMLVVDTVLGRPPEPDEESTQRLWESWNRRSAQLQDGLLPPEEYLAIHQETDISLRTVWNQTCRWGEYGALPLAGRGDRSDGERAP